MKVSKNHATHSFGYNNVNPFFPMQIPSNVFSTRAEPCNHTFYLVTHLLWKFKTARGVSWNSLTDGFYQNLSSWTTHMLVLVPPSRTGTTTQIPPRTRESKVKTSGPVLPPERPVLPPVESSAQLLADFRNHTKCSQNITWGWNVVSGT
jgi:hypothetical protein